MSFGANVIGTNVMTPHEVLTFFWGATTLSITTLSIMTLSIMTLSIMTLSIMTLSITTLSIKVLCETNSINNSQHKNTAIILSYITLIVVFSF
jgi:hypothetical protein